MKNSLLRGGLPPLPLLLTLLLPFAPLSLVAQEETGEVYELSPFEVRVEDDRGYRATTTTSGTALDTLIRDLPMGLEVITQEFIEDQQALDFREATAYSAGVFFESFEDQTAATQHLRSGTWGEFGDRSPSGAINIASPFANAISIRGYSVPNQQRMGFRIGAIVPRFGIVLGGSTDSANTQRQEVVRGPQSLLYGINVLSGVVNIIPRRPTSEVRTRSSMTLGSHKLRRFTLDHSGPLLPGHLNYRILGTYTEQGHWEDYRDTKRNYYAGQLDWFATPNLRIFLEGQYSMSKSYGGGPRFFVASGGDDTNFRNRYDQNYTFGRDFFNQDIIDDPELEEVTYTLEDGTGIPVFGNTKLIQKPGTAYEFPDLGREFRISGPDVRREEEEYNFLALAYLNPFEGLNVELGAYYTNTDIWSRNVSMGVFTDTSNTVRPAWDAPATGWAYDPESAWNWDTNENEDPYGYGIGELFLAHHPDVLREGEVVDDRRYASYAWYEVPTTSESLQLRGRAVYSFESEWIGDYGAKHMLMAGASHIKDRVNFVEGGVPNRAYVYSLGTPANDYADGKQDEDPLHFRSVFDYSVLRYEGETLAIPGRVAPPFAPDLHDLHGVVFTELETIANSGWREVDLTYRGYYGVYQGQMFDDRLTTVMGVRRDLYQELNRNQLRLLDHRLETDMWQGSGDVRRTPILLGYGNEPYEWRDDLPDALNERLEQDFIAMREERPDGTIEYSFDKPEQFTSKTAGISYRLTDDWSLYYLYSEGVFPNTGQRDGAGRAIEAEQTVNNEIGVKFDLFDGRVSGTVSAYQIERENAVWFWDNAPAPVLWKSKVERAADFDPFNPVAIRDGYLPLVYGVSSRYVHEAFAAFGLFPEELTAGEQRTLFREVTVQPYGAVNSRDWEAPTPSGWTGWGLPDRTRPGVTEGSAMADYMAVLDLHERFISGELDFWDAYPHPDSLRGSDAPLLQPGDTVRVGYEGKLVGPDERGVDMVVGNPLKLAMDLAIRDEGAPGNPLYWGPQAGNQGAHAASSRWGANVLYEEKGRGVDGQFIFRLLPESNYHILLSFSHQKREVVGTGFTLAPGYRMDDFGNVFRDGPNDGRWTTEYERWVWLLGPESFEDPTDPTSLKGGAIEGLDLSFVPRYSFRLWNKYEFRDNALEGLEIGGGMRYDGPVTTTLAIGGHNLDVNRFPTPDTPERYTWDAMVSYRSTWGDRIRWRAAFNVYNLTNNTESLATSEFVDDLGDPVYRRTRIFHAPRSYRFTLSLDF